eukprot:CAMPEP_0182894736 /NCGR_PEP_ID=MMETSP0034_2-20130328/25251_1 /TAXON_ID=156128 /ORGANISM="Nephroselmis pyriformis, Strain CCMP717" /LENGTH=263 /DNA_ID=CAMNT_0025028529 /DNA_START=36 /DNA_END=827 /DNA_ORIENTATION=+
MPLSGSGSGLPLPPLSPLPVSPPIIGKGEDTFEEQVRPTWSRSSGVAKPYPGYSLETSFAEYLPGIGELSREGAGGLLPASSSVPRGPSMLPSPPLSADREEDEEGPVDGPYMVFFKSPPAASPAPQVSPALSRYPPDSAPSSGMPSGLSQGQGGASSGLSQLSQAPSLGAGTTISSPSPRASSPPAAAAAVSGPPSGLSSISSPSPRARSPAAPAAAAAAVEEADASVGGSSRSKKVGRCVSFPLPSDSPARERGGQWAGGR